MTRWTLRRRELLARTALAGGALAAPMLVRPVPAWAQRQQKLVYWHLPTFTPKADEAARTHFEEFRKQAGLKDGEVGFVNVANADLIPRLNAALETGNPPDVVRLYESYVQLYRKQGHMLDVSSVVEKMKAEQGGLYPASLLAVSYGGKYWGVPFAINPWPMHVRNDVLAEHKLAYPKTWDEFVETCKKVQKPPFYGFGMDLGLTADATDNIMQLCWCFGGYTVDDKGKPAFDNPGNVAGFKFINDMYNKHRIIPKGVVSNADTAWNNQMYQSKQVAFINNPASVYAYLADKDQDLMKRTGLYSVPAGPAGAINQIDTWSIGLFRHTPTPELSMGLAAYMMTPKRYNEVITNTNGRFVPVYPDLFNDPWWTSRPEFKEFIKIAETGVPVSYKGPPTAASGEILATHVIPEALQTVLLENVPAEEAVKKVAGKIKAIYDRLEG
jgi:ABC-type glycerol-3-phosphate transport system substrate-binding protein